MPGSRRPAAVVDVNLAGGAEAARRQEGRDPRQRGRRAPRSPSAGAADADRLSRPAPGPASSRSAARRRSPRPRSPDHEQHGAGVTSMPISASRRPDPPGDGRAQHGLVQGRPAQPHRGSRSARAGQRLAARWPGPPPAGPPGSPLHRADDRLLGQLAGAAGLRLQLGHPRAGRGRLGLRPAARWPGPGAGPAAGVRAPAAPAAAPWVDGVAAADQHLGHHRGRSPAGSPPGSAPAPSPLTRSSSGRRALAGLQRLDQRGRGGGPAGPRLVALARLALAGRQRQNEAPTCGGQRPRGDQGDAW